MKRKKIFVKALALTATVFLAGSSVTVYGEAADANNTRDSEDTEQNADKDNSQEPDPASISDHEVHELDGGTVIEPTCTEKGYTLYKCTVDGCDYEIKKDEKDPLGHDMKEISRTEATDGEPGKIIYECQREGCSHQETVNTAEHPGDPEEDPEKTNPSEKPEPSVTPEPTTLAKPDNTDPNDSSDEEPEIDPDTEDNSQSYSSSTSTDIVTEYDPETAYSTMKDVHKPDTADETEDIEGRTVPEDTVDITRDASGNLTDLSVSTELEEIKNGFSVISEAETLRSVSVVNKVNPGAYWITFKSQNPAREMGIHLEHTDRGLTVILTENKNTLHITRVTEDAKNIILHTSSGGICEIRKDKRKFTADELNVSGEQKDQICLRDLKSNAPKIGFASSDKDKASESEKKDSEKYKEKDYWLLPYDEQDQEPVVITIYEKIKDTY